MEYILNESPYKTTNGFKINNIKLDLDIPEITYLNPVNKKFNSKIGLEFDKYDEYNITDDLTIEYSNSIGRVININVDDEGEYDILLKSLDDTKCFSYIKINTNIDNKKIKINVINLLNNKTDSFIAYDNKVNNKGELIINHIDLGGHFKVNNLYTELYDNSINKVNTIYIGDDNKLDYNYHIKNIGEKTISNMITEGILNNNSYKQHKGIIDFIEGCKKSIGEELENCILLDDKSISRSSPLLMCHEEDVEGAHGVSTGKIDKDKLFYLLSRGISEDEAKKIIILSNFNKIIDNINNLTIKDMVIEYINNNI
ncbi:MAG: SufD family Fe-S cluster assembly protein [Bacilli bacterium]|nr:SufD family Fe-S cluster assembly protein [Bacilli bacterium]